MADNRSLGEVIIITLRFCRPFDVRHPDLFVMLAMPLAEEDIIFSTNPYHQ